MDDLFGEEAPSSLVKATKKKVAPKPQPLPPPDPGTLTAQVRRYHVIRLTKQDTLIWNDD